MNIYHIIQKFPTNADCIKHLEKVKWNNKPICPYCESKEKWNVKNSQRYLCKDCKKCYSVTVNTIFHNSNAPLQKWFLAITLMMNAKKGISAKQLQRDISVTYKTAWSMAMRIRQAMHDDSIVLQGIVEMDETFVGGKPRKMANEECLKPKKRAYLDEKIEELQEQGFNFKQNSRKVACDIDVKRGRGSQKKIPIVGMVERDGNVVAKVMKNLTTKNLTEMVKKHVDKNDSVVITDSYRGYNKLNTVIENIKIDHKQLYSYKGVNTNTIESFWAIIKRGIVGQYHKVSLKYLPLYVSEFVYRYNNRNKAASVVFKETLQDASADA